MKKILDKLDDKCNISREIPESVKREVRQRSGFGCVFCGFPLCDYHHIEDWSLVKEHKPENLTLLCPNHHRKATNSLIFQDSVIKANDRPYNLYNKHAHDVFSFYGETCEIELGGNFFISEDMKNGLPLIPIYAEGLILLGFTYEDKHLFLHSHIFDSNNNLVLHIHKNQLIVENLPWDIRFEGRKLVIREKERGILLRLEIKSPNRIKVDSAKFRYKNTSVRIKNNELQIKNSKSIITQGCRFKNAIGITIGEPPEGIPVSICI